MPKILLTGATGFIGTHCIQPLLRKGFEVHCVSSKSRTTCATEIWHEADLLCAAEIDKLIKKVAPSHMLHLAWYAEPGTVNDPINLLWARSGLELIRLFEKYGGSRLVIGGSCLEYDWNYGFCAESLTPRISNSLYGCCKNSLFEMASRYATVTGLSLAWARLFFIYGPWENPNRLVPYVIKSLLEGDIARCSNGAQIRDYLHVQDVADALVELLVTNADGDFNIASGIPVTLRQIVATIAEQIGRPELIALGAVPKRDNDVALVVGNTEKFEQTLGWKPKINLNSGLEDTIEWWKSQGSSR